MSACFLIVKIIYQTTFLEIINFFDVPQNNWLASFNSYYDDI